MVGISFGDFGVTSWGVNPQTWRVRQNGVPSYVEIEAERDASVDELHEKAKAALAQRDIVDLLRREARSAIDAGVGDGWPCNEAADEILHLRRLLAAERGPVSERFSAADPDLPKGKDGTPGWAYDEDGYCVCCGNGRWKFHMPECHLRDALEALDAADPPTQEPKLD